MSRLGMLRRLRRLPPRELLTTVRALATLAAVEVTVRTMPVERSARLWGVPLDLRPVAAAPHWEVDELPVGVARASRCADRVTRRWPLASGPCLRRALVVGHLIRRFRPVLRLGVAAANDTMAAHAWLELDGRPLEDVTDFLAFQHPNGRA